MYERQNSTYGLATPEAELHAGWWASVCRTDARRVAGLRPQAAELVKLRFFADLTIDQAANLVGISWLRREMEWLADHTSAPSS